MPNPAYRGRLAPSPTGLLHIGHARTFWIAAQRAIRNHGTLVLRNEDLDPQRSRPEFANAMIEDLHWLGIRWSEGPDCGGPCAPYAQSERRHLYLEAWRRLRDGGFIYPCTCSRKDLAQAASAPNDTDDEPIYPGLCRHRTDAASFSEPAGLNWRFRVPNECGTDTPVRDECGTDTPVRDECGTDTPVRRLCRADTLVRPDHDAAILFPDLNLGPQRYVPGRDFGDFLIWRRDDVPAYQLAVVVDDAAMRITEVVRGADLLKSTARQILLMRALGHAEPAWFHCDLVRDAEGLRLAKRHDALSLRRLRESEKSPKEVLAMAGVL